MKRIAILSLLIVVVLSVPLVDSAHASGYVHISPGFKFITNTATMTAVTDSYYNVYYVVPANNTVWVSVSGLETSVEPNGRIIFTVASSGTGVFTFTIFGSQPTTVTCTSCSYSYLSGEERIVYTTSQSSTLTVIWASSLLSSTVNALQAGPTLAFPMDTVQSVSSTQWADKTRMIDTTPFHNDAILCNGSTTPSYIQGAFGGAEVFNGNQCWQVANRPGLNADWFGNYLTMTAWIRFDATPLSVGCLITKPLEYSMCIDSTARVVISLGGGIVLTGNTTLVVGNYYYVVSRWDSKNVQIFVNGVNDTASGGTFTSNIVENNNSVYIGGNSTTNFFTGMMDEVELFKRPLGQVEILNMMSNSNVNRPSDNFDPSTSACTGSDATIGACYNTYLNNNPELTSSAAPKGGNYADQNTTTYLVSPSTWHEVITFGGQPAGLAATFGVGNTVGCIGSPLYYKSSAVNAGDFWVHTFSGPNRGVDVCDGLRLSWDLFFQGVFQGSYGVFIGVNFGNATGATGPNNYCGYNNGAGTIWPCILYVTFYSQTNTLSMFKYAVGNLTQIGGVKVGAQVLSINLGIDFWLTSDQSRIGIRVSNYNAGSGNGNAEWNDWVTLCNGAGSACPTPMNGQFLEHFFTLKDSFGNVQPITNFDSLVRQNTESFANSCVDTGNNCGNQGSSFVISQISNHRDLNIQQIICYQNGWALPVVAGIIAGVAAGAVAGVEIGAAVATVTITYCANLGGIEPSTNGLGIFGGGGIGCGIFTGVCTAISTLAGSIGAAVGSTVTTAFTTALNDFAVALSSAIINGLRLAWGTFAAGMDGIIATITGGRVQRGFSTFWVGVTAILSTLAVNSGSIINGTTTGFGSVVTIMGSIIIFFGGAGTNVLGTLATVLTTVLGNNALAQFVVGSGNLLLSLFGKGNGPNGTQFTANGITYDWGPGGQILGNSGFQTFIILLIGLWLLMNLLRHPIEFGHQMGSLLYYWGHVFITILMWFFDLFMKIVSWLKSLIPTWGGSGW